MIVRRFPTAEHSSYSKAEQIKKKKKKAKTLATNWKNDGMYLHNKEEKAERVRAPHNGNKQIKQKQEKN